MPADPTPARRPLWAAAAWGCVLGALAAGLGEVGRMLLFHNRHTVIPGVLYRSAQQDAAGLRAEIDRAGIRTVVNLRGPSDLPWYTAQAACVGAAGVGQEDVTLSANRLPSAKEIRRLVDIFDRCEYPVLIHCQQGADRTGLAAAVWELLYTDADCATARRQCSPRYGHVRAMGTARMDEFFDQYEAWLAGRCERHSPAALRTWIADAYLPGPAAATLAIAAPATLPAGRASVLRLSATNTSREAWPLSPNPAAGVHVRYFVWDAAGEGVYAGRAGLRIGTVLPGETAVFDLPLPPMPRPGRHRLLATLARKDNDFTQFGVDPAEFEWVVTCPAK